MSPLIAMLLVVTCPFGEELPEFRAKAEWKVLKATAATLKKEKRFDELVAVQREALELAASLADSPRSVILQQVTNGVATRMAVMHLLVNGGTAS